MQLTAAADVAEQRARDTRRGGEWGLWADRVSAVLAAKVAVAESEFGARYALRQALIDLASCSEAMADELPAATVCRKSVGSRYGHDKGVVGRRTAR